MDVLKHLINTIQYNQGQRGMKDHKERIWKAYVL
jgi:hypothetical protein